MKDVSQEINDEAARRTEEFLTAHNLAVIASTYRMLAESFAELEPDKLWTNSGLADFFSEAVDTLEKDTQWQKEHSVLGK